MDAYVIQHSLYPHLYWSEDWGWGEVWDATFYPEAQPTVPQEQLTDQQLNNLQDVLVYGRCRPLSEVPAVIEMKLLVVLDMACWMPDAPMRQRLKLSSEAVQQALERGRERFQAIQQKCAALVAAR